MLCQRCFKKQATVKISQTQNGILKEQLICKSCSKKYGLNVTISSLPQAFTEIIVNILRHKQEDQEILKKNPTDSTCPDCGYNWEDFRKTGLLGCEKCYTSFRGRILTLQNQVVKKNEFISQPYKVKNPRIKKNERAILERALTKAVDREEYEKAAKIRDRIIELNKKQGDK